ncbi:hypothetical protein [Roseivivax marinus]|uniref:hypothetical protein n=1 Tax=Roseivivax marinus TaxID=1379903 RepID=UPI00273E0A49|nr:hypothetical protein [Roseivivax marinus]
MVRSLLSSSLCAVLGLACAAALFAGSEAGYAAVDATGAERREAQPAVRGQDRPDPREQSRREAERAPRTARDPSTRVSASRKAQPPRPAPTKPQVPNYLLGVFR